MFLSHTASVGEGGIVDTARPCSAFLLVDAAQSFSMRLHLEGIGVEHRCLLSGPEAEARAATLPYLVPLERFGSATEWFRDEAFGRNWGILVATTLPAETLVRDVKKFIRCDFLGEKNTFFRFYRPETFRAFVPVMPPREQAALLRGKTVYAEASGSGRMTRFAMADGRLTERPAALDDVLDTLLFEAEA